MNIGPVHELQQRGIFDIQIARVNAVRLRALAPRQSHRFAQRLNESFDSVARIYQQAACHGEVDTAADEEFQALIIGKHANFVDLAAPLQIENIVLVARRRVDLAFDERIQPRDAALAHGHESNVPVRIEPETLQRLARDPVLAAVGFAGADAFAFQLARPRDRDETAASARCSRCWQENKSNPSPMPETIQFAVAA